MLAVALTFHEPSSLLRPPSVPHVYVMQKKKKKWVEYPHEYVGDLVFIFVKGDDFFFNDKDRIQSDTPNPLVIFTSSHAYNVFSRQPVVPFHFRITISFKGLEICLRWKMHHSQHYICFSNCRACYFCVVKQDGAASNQSASIYLFLLTLVVL